MRKILLIICLAVPTAFVGGWYWLFRDSWGAERKTAEAREKFAFQSLETRLPKGKPIALIKPFTSAAAKRWEVHESNIDHPFRERAELLKALHERTRQFFVQARGAGAERRIIKDEDILMGIWANSDSPGDQPGAGPDFPLSAGEKLMVVSPDDNHHLYHDGAALTFLNPAGFGYIKDRNHVAGFVPHGFGASLGRYVFKPLKYDHVQLVGILMLDQPAVYLTQGLPSMEQVRQGKTRNLDPFEEAGLNALRSGEDLFVAEKGETVRMFGALRATKQCLLCHDANRGDLLGALSYTLRPQTPEPGP